ncbi:MAG: Rieske (2Fe-2S) protein [Terriglobales bacterium]
MPQFTRIAAKADLPGKDEAKEFTVGEKIFCVANVEGRLCALDNVCLHRGGPLGQGVIADGTLICPWHGWQYNPQTGEAVQNPAAKVAVYPIKVEGDDVLVEI